jgi:hypothetical protein
VSTDFGLLGGLSLPKRLLALIDSGRWPRTEGEAQRQNLRPLVSMERIHLFAPEQDRIYLISPPFHTVAERRGVRPGDKFWSSFAAPDGISPELSIDIGAFGLGSDAPILLDYRENSSDPSVIRLVIRWQLGQPNLWVRCAETFDEFADMLGLDQRISPQSWRCKTADRAAGVRLKRFLKLGSLQ